MKVIIAGGRDFDNILLADAEVSLFVNSNASDSEEIEVVSGSCDRGVLTYTREDGTKVYGGDGIGERIAHWNGWKVKLFPADWKKHGKSAGPIRNKQMAEYANHCIVFWDGKSRGAKNMIELATKQTWLKVINYKPTPQPA